MRKIAAYYLYLFYATAFCQSLTIWFADGMAHICMADQHFALVHHENGKDHVHYQISGVLDTRSTRPAIA